MPQPLGDRLSARRRVVTIVTLGLLTGLGPFTIDLYLPAFPVLKTDLGITDSQVQVTLSATTLGFALGQFVVGPLSDWLGRRIPLIAAASLHVISSVLVAVAPDVTFLTTVCVLRGIGAASGAMVSMAMTRDLFSGRRLVVTLSRLVLINGPAPIIAPLMGSWMVTVMNWRGVFWALASCGAVLLVLILSLIVETRPSGERTTGGLAPLRTAYRRVPGDRVFIGIWLTASCCFAGLFSYISASLLLL